MSARRQNLKRKAADDAVVKETRDTGVDLGNDLEWEYHSYGKEAKAKGQFSCPYKLFALKSATLLGCEKAAGFEIDFTVIKTASGRKFATAGATDWEWWDDCVPEKLQSLHKDGYRVIFFTNQAGIQDLKVNYETLLKKIEAMIKKLNIPILAFVCTGENEYQKPSTLMWEYWEKNCNQGVKVDRSKCIYVGHAAGRVKEWAPGKPEDLSCSDRKFAHNLGVEFHTPEVFFLVGTARFTWRSINPVSIIDKAKTLDKKEYHSKSTEMVIMVGCPASGKSTFRKQYFEPHGYIAVNRDTMGTMQKCIKAAQEALKSNKSVVVDNTNPSIAARKYFIDCATEAGVPFRCFVMDTELEVAHHLNYFRQRQTNGKIARIPDVAYDQFKKNYKAPTNTEGFSEIVHIPFVPQFDNKDDEELFKQWIN